jgi:hypothetical protein
MKNYLQLLRQVSVSFDMTLRVNQEELEMESNTRVVLQVTLETSNLLMRNVFREYISVDIFVAFACQG